MIASKLLKDVEEIQMQKLVGESQQHLQLLLFDNLTKSTCRALIMKM
jgi:hypothetical protein